MQAAERGVMIPGEGRTLCEVLELIPELVRFCQSGHSEHSAGLPHRHFKFVFMQCRLSCDEAWVA
jgi:hypothetical protein